MSETQLGFDGPQRATQSTDRRLALVLGGGAARGLAHIGVLECLEAERIRPHVIVGSSMGALIGALSASGLRATQIASIARTFHFPRRFVPGGLLRWEDLFGAAAPALRRTFEELHTPLAVTAVDLERGCQVILHRGLLLDAVRASMSVPGVLQPVRLDGRWLVDGGIVNMLPVDLAWMHEPDVTVAVDLGSSDGRAMRSLDWRITRWLSRLGELVPNPGTAKVSLEVLIRCTEIMLDRQTTLATAMTAPDVLIRPALGDIDLRAFERVDEAVAAGLEATRNALPELRRALERQPSRAPVTEHATHLRFDPVCGMVISPSRARASALFQGTTFHFCSDNCRVCFERDPAGYASGASASRP